MGISFFCTHDLDFSKFEITTEGDSMATVDSDKAEQGVDSAVMEKQDEEMDSKLELSSFLCIFYFLIHYLSLGQWIFGFWTI